MGLWFIINCLSLLQTCRHVLHTAFITVWFVCKAFQSADVTGCGCPLSGDPAIWRERDGWNTFFNYLFFSIFVYMYVLYIPQHFKNHTIYVYIPWHEFCICIFISNIDVRRVNPYTLHVRNYSWAMMVLSWFALVWEASAVLYSQLLVSSSPKIWIDE